MSFSPVAKLKTDKLSALTAQEILGRGISLIMLDLDNTIAGYHDPQPEQSVLEWAMNMKQNNVTLYIVSNSHRDERVRKFADFLGIGYVNRARKPFAKVMRAVLERTGTSPKNAAMVGDQVFTDVIAANACGVLSVIVKPLKLTNPLYALRYAAEIPFRMVAKSRV